MRAVKATARKNLCVSDRDRAKRSLKLHGNRARSADGGIPHRADSRILDNHRAHACGKDDLRFTEIRAHGDVRFFREVRTRKIQRDAGKIHLKGKLTDGDTVKANGFTREKIFRVDTIDIVCSISGFSTILFFRSAALRCNLHAALTESAEHQLTADDKNDHSKKKEPKVDLRGDEISRIQKQHKEDQKAEDIAEIRAITDHGDNEDHHAKHCPPAVKEEFKMKIDDAKSFKKPKSAEDDEA